MKIKKVSPNDMKLVKEIYQRQGVFSSGESKSPIIATYGAGPCVIVEGYSNEFKRGFLIHWDYLTDKKLGEKNNLYWIPKSLTHIGYFGTKDITKKVEYKIRILQGTNFPGILNPIKNYFNVMNSFKDKKISFKIIQERIGGKPAQGENIALDLRNGETFSYDPFDNPLSKRLDSFYIESLKFPSQLN